MRCLWKTQRWPDMILKMESWSKSILVMVDLRLTLCLQSWRSWRSRAQLDQPLSWSLTILMIQLLLSKEVGIRKSRTQMSTTTTSKMEFLMKVLKAWKQQRRRKADWVDVTQKKRRRREEERGWVIQEHLLFRCCWGISWRDVHREAQKR